MRLGEPPTPRRTAHWLPHLSTESHRHGTESIQPVQSHRHHGEPPPMRLGEPPKFRDEGGGTILSLKLAKGGTILSLKLAKGGTILSLKFCAIR